MARPRVELQTIFEKVLGSRNAYFQPPANIRMSYPAIAYELDDMPPNHADNQVYLQYNRYKVTVIDPDPDSAIPVQISKLPMCRFSTQYTSDNLNHTVFELYF